MPGSRIARWRWRKMYQLIKGSERGREWFWATFFPPCALLSEFSSGPTLSTAGALAVSPSSGFFTLKRSANERLCLRRWRTKTRQNNRRNKNLPSDVFSFADQRRLFGFIFSGKSHELLCGCNSAPIACISLEFFVESFVDGFSNEISLKAFMTRRRQPRRPKNSI